MADKQYLSLRNYVHACTGINLTDIDRLAAAACFVSDKTIQNITGTNGKRKFSINEAKATAELFVDKFLEHDNINKAVFTILIKDFLIHTITENEFAESAESMTSAWIATSKLNVEACNKEEHYTRYSSIPSSQYTGGIVRTEKVKQIKNAINNHKIAFLSGLNGTGKSFIASQIANEYFEQNLEFKTAVWIECFQINSFIDIINELLTAFQIPKDGTQQQSEKINLVESFLKNNKIILVLDGFEEIIDNNEQEKILNILTKYSHSVFIITCNKKISYFHFHNIKIEFFSDFQLKNLTLNQWTTIAKFISYSNDTIKEAIENKPELISQIYDSSSGNLSLMIHYLTNISSYYLLGLNPDMQNLDNSKKFENIISNLSDNNSKLLMTLSLFANPINSETLYIISHLNGIDDSNKIIYNSDLATSLLQCTDMYLIDSIIKNENIYYNISSVFKPILRNVLLKNPMRYQDIVESWINYYKSISNDIGFCYNDVTKLSRLDNLNEINNIKTVLYFCEHLNYLEDFYTISENLKYYFYTRGISGYGKNSIHYKRAIIASKLGKLQEEFDALLYHCNIECKVKSKENIESCFSRMDEIIQITNISSSKLLKYKYVKALYLYMNESFEDAINIFKEYETEISFFISTSNDDDLKHDYIACLRWHVECILTWHKLKNSSISEDIDSILDKCISLAQEIHFSRAIIHSYILKIKFAININHLEKVPEYLAILSQYTEIIESDYKYSCEYADLINEWRNINDK